MNWNRLSGNSLAAVVSALMLLASIPAPQARAQAAAGSAQQQPNPFGAGGIQSFLSGLNIGPMMMSFGGASGIMTDFTRNSERSLLKRHDVRSELFIDSKQRDQLDDVDTKGQQDLQKHLQENLIQNLANNPDLKNLGQQNGGAPPDLGALKDTLNSAFQSMQDSLQVFQSDLDSRSETLLNPKQIKRLHELDLQWRGLLALSDKKVAGQLTVTADQKTVVDAALKSYQTAQMNILQPVMMQAAQAGQATASGNGRLGPGFDPAQMQKSLLDAMEGDAVKKARTTAEEKVNASLTADQKLLWKKMLGQKFYFMHLDK